MKATFVYSNGLTFSINNVVEQSLIINRNKRKGLPDKVTVEYSVTRNIPTETINGLIANIYSSPEKAANGITSKLECIDLIYDEIDAVERITIDATEAGLTFILMQGQNTDPDSEGVITPDIFAEPLNDEQIKPVVIIPVLDKKIDRLVVADCLSLML